MRHGMVNRKLGRTTGHRLAMFRNQLASLIDKERIITTLPKAKELRPQVERLITLGKNDSVHARRQAAAYLMTPESVDRLFATVAPRYAARNGGYLRITRLGARKGDAAEMAYIELLGAEHELNEKAQKRAEARTKKREELAKQMEERGEGEAGEPNAEA